jgi:hydroxymethylbilane synthase
MALPLLRIGTRGSPLALAQAAELRQRLADAHGELAAPGAIETIIIRTSGDRQTGRPISEEGGKGLFTKEIEEALLAGSIDLAVHSMKDMPAELPEGLDIACLLPRADPRDALIAAGSAAGLKDLPRQAALGTSSLRRQAQALLVRGDLRIAPLRGNVGTRLAKVKEGGVGATILAVAGLTRLGLTGAITAILDPEEMLPAPAQGAIGIEIRDSDDKARRYLAPVNDGSTASCVNAERAALTALGGDCHTPFGAYATLKNGTLTLRALVIKPDGTGRIAVQREGAASDAAEMGADAGAELIVRAGAEFLAGLPGKAPGKDDR